MDLVRSPVDESHRGDESLRIEEELVEAARLGDAQAFVQLSTPHTSRLMCQINRIMKNRQDAEDILQESILRAFVHLESFQGESAFSTWLTRIAINTALMGLRRRRVVLVSLDEESEDGESTAWTNEPRDRRGSPEQQLMEREREEMFWIAIRRLTPVLRDVIRLHLRGYRGREIAKTLGITVGAVKSRLARGRGELRTLVR